MLALTEVAWFAESGRDGIGDSKLTLGIASRFFNVERLRRVLYRSSEFEREMIILFEPAFRYVLLRGH